MNDIIFSNSFHFCTIEFNKYHYTDNRAGTSEHYFAYMLSGKCKIVTDSKTVELRAGDFLYIPNKCSYQSYWHGEPTVRFISLGFSYMPNIDHKVYYVQSMPHEPNAARLFTELAASDKLTADDIGKFYALTAQLLPMMNCAARCRTKEIVSLSQQYLTLHPNATSAELAKNCAVSEAALYSAFRKASNTTPNELKGRMLLDRAKEMLIETDKPIEHISDTLGFSSASYFRKKFKQYFGITPREMRKSHGI